MRGSSISRYTPSKSSSWSFFKIYARASPNVSLCAYSSIEESVGLVISLSKSHNPIPASRSSLSLTSSSTFSSFTSSSPLVVPSFSLNRDARDRNPNRTNSAFVFSRDSVSLHDSFKAGSEMGASFRMVASSLLKRASSSPSRRRFSMRSVTPPSFNFSGQFFNVV